MSNRKEYEEYLRASSEPTAQSNSALGFVANVAKIGAVVGGVAAAKHFGVGTLASRFLAPATAKTRTAYETVHAFGQALDETMSTRSVLSFFSDETADTLGRSFAMRMRSVEASRGERLGSGLTEFTSKVRTHELAMQDIEKTIYEGKRFEQILGDMEKHAPLIHGEEILHTILPKLKEQKAYFFKGVNPEEIASLIKSSDLREDLHETTFDLISGVIKKNENFFNIDSKGLVKLPHGVNQSEIDQSIAKARDILDTDLKTSMGKKDRFAENFMRKLGTREATVNDFLENGWFKSGVGIAQEKEGAKGSIETAIEWDKKVRELAAKDPSILDLTVDPRLLIRNGKLVDTRHVKQAGINLLDRFSKNYEVPFVHINPVRMAHWYSKKGVMQAPDAHVFHRGDIMPLMFGKDRLESNYLYAGNKLFDLTVGEVVKENVYAASARFGMLPRAIAAMAGFEKNSIAAARVASKQKGGIKNWFRNVLDLGYQDFESDISRTASVFTKYNNPRYAPNRLAQLQQNPVSQEGIESYRALYNFINSRSNKLGPVGMEKLAGVILPTGGTLAQRYGLNAKDFAASTEDEIISLLAKVMNTGTRTKGTISSDSPMQDVLWSYVKDYEKNPIHFKETYHTAPAKASLVPGLQASLEGDSAILYNRFDDVQKAIQMDMLYQLETVARSEGVDGLGLISGLNKREMGTVQDLMVLNRMHGEGNKTFMNIFKGSDEEKTRGISDFFHDFFADSKDQTTYWNRLQESVKSHSSILDAGPGQIPAEHFEGGRYQLVNKARNPIVTTMATANKLMAEGASFIEVVAASAQTFVKDTIGQLGFGPKGFRAGRGNMENVTTATIGSHFGFSRLSDAMGHGAGIGLSNKSMGSPQDAYLSLMMKRLYGPALAIGYLGYADYLTEKVIGKGPKEAAADTYVQGRVTMAGVKDKFGITGMSKRASMIFSGQDQVAEWLPMKALDFASLGLIGPGRTQQETVDYYSKGVDAVKKGRYWAIGSATPWAGERVSNYQANWYRRLKSDYMMTDVMYGSKGEYYSHQPYPTFSNPLGPIKTLLLDPHHWNNRHWDDRPYPTSGGSSYIEDIPLFGPALSGMLDAGGLINNTQRKDLSKAHRKYLKDINERIKERETYTPQFVYVSPGGGISFTDRLYGGSGIEGMTLAGAGSVGGDGEGGMNIPRSGAAGYGTSNINIPVVTMREYSRGTLTEINREIINKSLLRDTEFKDLYIRDLQELDFSEPAGMPSRLGQTWYSSSEMAGFYGFSASSLTGGNEPNYKNRYASSTYMDTSGRQFWDANYGGFGGMPNEIFRRFLPKNTMRRKAFNPYRNKMPDWMPGLDYFQDFKHGDPYAQIPKGEMRLPGKGYEAMNHLHPDAYDEEDYGIFDRFKILADVAPYSEEYRMYEAMIPQLNLDTAHKAEVKQIKKQVGAMKTKYITYPYRFKGGAIDQHEVTVTQVIDDTTFLTKEFPDHPIRMAGLDFMSTADPTAVAEARAQIQEVIHFGAKVRIGIDQDASKRVKNDTRGTMPAAVFIIEGENKGRPLQATLIRKNSPAIKERTNDYSAPSVYGRFYGEEIGIGKIWETLAHTDSPFNTKFLNVRSPLEMYERKEIYGKAWQPWTSPFKSILQPTIESYMADAPIKAVVQGAVLGGLIGGKAGAAIGAVTVGSLSVYRVLKETVTGDTWIPNRRVKEREVEEYFDILKYVKFQGLYEKARKRAIEEEGVDVAEIINARNKSKRGIKAQKRALTKMKRWLKAKADNITDPLLKETNLRLNQFADNRTLMKLGPYSMQALYYNLQSQSTVHGVDPYSDMTVIYRALPKKDRQFYQSFMNATPEEKARIMEVVPKNQRKIYQARWGMKVDKAPDLKKYFGEHELPGSDWIGWKPGVNLNDVKLKVVKNEGLEATEFGFWDDDEPYAEKAPSLEPFRPSMMGRKVEANLRKALKGAGLDDVDVEIKYTPASGTSHIVDIAMDLYQDARKDFIDGVNNTTNLTLM